MELECISCGAWLDPGDLVAYTAYPGFEPTWKDMIFCLYCGSAVQTENEEIYSENERRAK